MTDIRYYCDRCAERITADRSQFKPATGPWRHRDPIDLCATCFDEFQRWLGPGPGRVRASEDKAA